MIDRERRARDDVLIVYIGGDPDNPARPFAHADEVHDRVGPHDVPIEGILAGEHSLRRTLADDHYRFAATPVIIVEVPAFHDGHAERREKSRRNRAKLRQRVLVVTAFYVTFARELLANLGIAATPGVDFDAERGSRYVRFCYAGTTEDMAEAARRLQGWNCLSRRA